MGRTHGANAQDKRIGHTHGTKPLGLRQVEKRELVINAMAK